ncbi:hypothetical protein ACVI1L_004879 [Bradyrhizobium sp. USDA 4516]
MLLQVFLSIRSGRLLMDPLEYDLPFRGGSSEVEEAHLTFQGKSDGEIAFGALKGLDVRYGTRNGSACADFS